MEIALYPNFDYEFELAKVPLNSIRREVVKRFEWLALLEITDGVVLLQNDYPSEYFAHLSRFKSLPKVVVNASRLKNWWGELADLELERKLNSKVFAAELARDVLGFEFSPLSLGDSLKKGWLAKREYSVSGRGIITASENRELAQAAFSEPWYERTLDIGSRYRLIEGNWKLIERSVNEIDERFNFRGAKLSLKMNFDQGFKQHDDDQLKILQALSECFKKVSEIQMDSFFYRKDQSEWPKALCEFNYRKSVVSVLYRFLSLINIEEALWLMRPVKPLGLRRWQELALVSQSYNAILLSPPEARDLGILICDQSLLKDFRLELADKFAIEL